MSRSNTSLVVIVVAAAAAIGGMWFSVSGMAQVPESRPGQNGAKVAGQTTEPFMPAVGRNYEVFMPNGRNYSGEGKSVHIRKVFSNGWVEIKTAEGQVAWLNLAHAMQVYVIEGEDGRKDAPEHTSK